MNALMNAFTQGFMKGAKETPRGFFAPVIAILCFLLNTTESHSRHHK
jgi:hypothetical protein